MCQSFLVHKNLSTYFLVTSKYQLGKWLHRCDRWWQLWFKISVMDSLHWKSHQDDEKSHHHKVTTIILSPTWPSLGNYRHQPTRQRIWSMPLKKLRRVCRKLFAPIGLAGISAIQSASIWKLIFNGIAYGPYLCT